MDVVLDGLRRIEVDDVLDARDVDSARRNVGRHEHAVLALAEAFERRGALALLRSEWMRSDGMALDLELPAGPLGVDLATQEDESAPLVALEQRDETLLLVLLLDEVEPMLDALRSPSVGQQIDTERVLHEPADESFDLGRHRGREHHRAALFRQRAQDLADLR